MLHDRSNWPIISAPAGAGRAGTAAQMAPGHRRGQSLAHEATIEEEEDVSRGDALDFMTPRDVSRMRYEQHHEWMEEILESPYATKQIVPSELGLGKKGTLETFTTGFFTAPTSTAQDPPNGKIGRMDPGKAEEFTKHANQKLAEMQADLEEMKQRHIRRMEKLRRTTELGAAERKLRNMSVNGSDDSFQGVALQVQKLVGKKIEPVAKVACISKGGLQEIKPVVPTPQESTATHQTSVQQANTNQGQGQQQQTQAQAQQQQSQPSEQEVEQKSTQPQAQPASTQQSAQSSKVVPEMTDEATSGSHTTETVQATQTPDIPKTEQPHDDSDTHIDNNDAVDNNDDINMSGLDDQDIMAGDDNVDAAGWDIINDQDDDNGIDDNQGQDVNQELEDTIQSRVNSISSQQQAPPTSQSNENTPMGETNDFDMVEDFDANMDTAGDALADYNADEDLNLDDSAFGDAFHHNEQELS